MHTSPVLYVRGPFRVVPAPPPARDTVLIVDDAGRQHGPELALDAACAWIDQRLASTPAPAARRAR